MGVFADIFLMEDIEFSFRFNLRCTFATLRDTVTTSFRRWEQHGPLRTILRMWTIRLLYWLGRDPRLLQHYYYDTLR